jgi:hypothetical protein
MTSDQWQALGGVALGSVIALIISWRTGQLRRRDRK